VLSSRKKHIYPYESYPYPKTFLSFLHKLFSNPSNITMELSLSLCPACDEAYSSDNMPVTLTSCHHLLCTKCLGSLTLSDEDTCPACKLSFVHSECVPDHALADFFEEMSALAGDAARDDAPAPAAKKPRVAEDLSLLPTVQGLHDKTVADIAQVEMVAKALKEKMLGSREYAEMSILQHEHQIQEAKLALDALHERKKKEVLQLVKDMEKTSGASMTSLEVTRGQMQAAAAMHRRALDTKTQLGRSAAHVPVAWDMVCGALALPKDFGLRFSGEMVSGVLEKASMLTCTAPDPKKSLMQGDGLDFFSARTANSFTFYAVDMFGNYINDLCPEDVDFSCVGRFPPDSVTVTVTPLVNCLVQVDYTFAPDCNPDVVIIGLSVRSVDLFPSTSIHPGCVFAGELLGSTVFEEQVVDHNLATAFLLDTVRGVAFVARTGDLTVRMFNVQTGAMCHSHALAGVGDGDVVTAFALAPDGKLLVGTPTQVHEMELDGSTVTGVRVLPIEVDLSASMACNDAHVMVMRPNRMNSCAVYNRDGVFQKDFGFFFCPRPCLFPFHMSSKNYVALGGLPGYVDIWDVDAGTMFRRIECENVARLDLDRRASSLFTVVPEQGLIVFLTDKRLSVISWYSDSLIRSKVMPDIAPEGNAPLAFGRDGNEFYVAGSNATRLHYFA